MIDTTTIKCSNCGWDSGFPANQPMGIVLNENVICPHCGAIVIFSNNSICLAKLDN